jgi:hypothetical protein
LTEEKRGIMIEEQVKTTKNENPEFDEKLLKKVSTLSDQDIAALVKAAKAEKKKKKAELKENFSKAAGKIVLKYLKDIERNNFPENFRKEVLSARDKILSLN